MGAKPKKLKKGNDVLFSFVENKKNFMNSIYHIHNKELEEIIYDNTEASGERFFIQKLVSCYETLKDICSKYPEFTNHFYETYDNYIKNRKEMKEKSELTFDEVCDYFSCGDEIVVQKYTGLEAGVVMDATRNDSMFGPYLSIRYRAFHVVNDEVSQKTESCHVWFFKRSKPIGDLPVRLLKNQDEINMLTERGKKYLDLATGGHLKETLPQATLYVSNWFGVNTFNVIGRVMIDEAAYAQMTGDYEYSYGNKAKYDFDSDTVKQNLRFFPSALHAFSFNLRKWGEIRLDDLVAPKFNHKVFENLVFDPKKKALISSIIESKYSNVDYVANKGGGVIFLLHGNPGTGKTLTAEAIAEKLEKPLYPVQVGELGNEPDELEKRLRKVLDLCEKWDAVLLLDECDIFLEERQQGAVLQNSLVSVFLRLVEYYQGVAFLTTNRATCLDKAILSRVSMSINYPDLQKDSRKQIWENLVKNTNAKNVDCNKLAEQAINGRQIKNILNMSQRLADHNAETLTQDHIEFTMDTMLQSV